MGTDRHCLIAGGGAAGFFAAIACAEAAPGIRITLCEATAHPLAKVRVSGGGRCNVTHACFDPAELVKRFPRGGRELLGPFHRWQPRDTIAWFAGRGVELKTEEDGRMFPTTDDSATIVDCLMGAAREAGVVLRTGTALTALAREDGRYRATLGTGETPAADRVLIATGGGRSSAGFEIARRFGHTVEPLVPSLFTFHVADPRLEGLAGVCAGDAQARIEGAPHVSRGPALVTHAGLSGPAILKLSAWAARDLAAREYRFVLRISWIGGTVPAEGRAALAEFRRLHPKRQVASSNPFGLPARLWERLAQAAGLPAAAPWAGMSNEALESLLAQVVDGRFAVTGKTMNKEEFVTCGGVRLAEVDFRAMESKRSRGLHFAGEVLDIDGVTGGFNFQAAWTTGRIAGLAMAARRGNGSHVRQTRQAPSPKI